MTQVAIATTTLAVDPAADHLRPLLGAERRLAGTAGLVDLHEARLVALDRNVDKAEDDGMRARWDFGREMLTRRKGKKLPPGELNRVVELIGKSRSEIQARMRFAERIPTEEALHNAVMQYGSWHAIANDLLATSGRNPTLSGSTTVECYTPAKYVNAAREVLGGAIDLDPASSLEANKTVKAEKYFSLKDDGLAHDWHGRVWMNPPYSRSTTGPFVTKLVDEFEAGRVTAAIVLLNGYGFDASWFRPLWDHHLCFTDHRIQFYGGGPTFGSVFVYLGPDRSRFIEVFSDFGTVMERAQVVGAE